MNDWWDYLAHSQLGKEREGHKYYARVPDGTDRQGRIRYRYFYDAREYGAWKTRQQNKKSQTGHGPWEEKDTKKENGRTRIITGWSDDGKLPDKVQMEQVRSMTPTRLGRNQTSLKKGVRGIDTPVKTMFGQMKQGTKSSVRTISVSTVTNRKALAQRGKDMVAKLLKREK